MNSFYKSRKGLSFNELDDDAKLNAINIYMENRGHYDKFDDLRHDQKQIILGQIIDLDARYNKLGEYI